MFGYSHLSKLKTGLPSCETHYRHWDDKASFNDNVVEYSERTGRTFPFLPKAYSLYKEKDRKAFLERLEDGNSGMARPWVLKKGNVNQSRGITMFAGGSKDLKEIHAALVRGDETMTNPENGYIMQEYLCNPLLFNGRKFDLRTFWMVASVDPLVVLYYDGGVMRVSGQPYNETNFDVSIPRQT